ncbi:MAG: DUF6702 family protein [Xenococcaceae cyanobacterium]
MAKNRKFRYLWSNICIALLFFLLLVSNAASHSPGQSYLFLKIYDRSIEVRVEMTVGDLNKALDLELPTDGSVELEDINTHLDEIRAYVASRLEIGANQQAYPLQYKEYGLFSTSFAQYLTINYLSDELEEIPQKLDIYYGALFDVKPEHRGLLVVEHNWKTGTFANESIVSLIFSPVRQQQSLDLSSSTLLRGFLGIVNLGIWHIWEGIDHILFLIALILPSVLRREGFNWRPVQKFRPAFIYVVKVATSFTIAHSITLSLAALHIVEMPSRLVESIIAASIGFAAADIIYPLFRGKIWLIIFGFGLFHGFGFASVLAELGIIQEHLVLSLFGFNLGVEIGQVAIICLVFPILYALRNSRFYSKIILRFGVALLFTAALYWFIERAFDVDIPVFALVRRLFDYI